MLGVGMNGPSCSCVVARTYMMFGHIVSRIHIV